MENGDEQDRIVTDVNNNEFRDRNSSGGLFELNGEDNVISIGN